MSEEIIESEISIKEDSIISEASVVEIESDCKSFKIGSKARTLIKYDQLHSDKL